MSNFMKKDWNIVKHFKTFAIISLSIILIGVVVLCFTGLNLGIEFAGGVELSVNFEENTVSQSQYEDIQDAIKSQLREAGLAPSDGSKISNGDIIDGIKFSYKIEINSNGVDDGTMGVVYEMLEKGGSALTAEDRAVLTPYLGSNFDFDSFKSIAAVVSEMTDGGITATPSIYLVGASVSSKLLQTSLIALTVALVLILVYIVIRFRTLGAQSNFVSGLKSGLAAIIALVHDVLIMFAFIIIAGWLFNLQITSTFVAAVVTIVAYSINNTIVVFDRIRDNTKRFGDSKTIDDLVNKSVKDVFTRSVFTSLTTIIAVLILTILGISALREFTLPILIGLLAGTYSSLFIAPCLWKVFSGSKKVKEPKNAQ